MYQNPMLHFHVALPPYSNTGGILCTEPPGTPDHIFSGLCCPAAYLVNLMKHKIPRISDEIDDGSIIPCVWSVTLWIATLSKDMYVCF